MDKVRAIATVIFGSTILVAGLILWLDQSTSWPILDWLFIGVIGFSAVLLTALYAMAICRLAFGWFSERTDRDAGE